MRTILLTVTLGILFFAKAQDIIITSTQLLDGKSKFRFKERYTERFTSNTVKYEYDSKLNLYVSDQIRINKTKTIFLPDSTRINKRIKINKHQIVLTDSAVQAFILLLQDTTKNSDGFGVSVHVSHRYEHIYVYFIDEKDTITFHIFNPESQYSSWENRKHPYHRTNTGFDRLLFMIMPEEFLHRESIKMRL
jgi:hypothetical protein